MGEESAYAEICSLELLPSFQQVFWGHWNPGSPHFTDREGRKPDCRIKSSIQLSSDENCPTNKGILKYCIFFNTKIWFAPDTRDLLARAEQLFKAKIRKWIDIPVLERHGLILWEQNTEICTQLFYTLNIIQHILFA